MDNLSNSFPTHDPDWVRDMHADHYLQSWSKQGNRPRVITGAQGSWFWDSDGKRYLDFQSQLVNANLGHQHPKIIQAIKDQADRLCYIGPAMGHRLRSELARLADKHPSIGDRRGLGMFNGVELVKDRGTREPLVPFAAKGDDARPMTEVLGFAMNRGLYLSCFSNVIRLTPPLNISEEDLLTGLEILDRTLGIADRECR